METLRPFQKRFLKNALAPGVDISALSMPRGNGKSFLAAHILTRCLTPGDALFEYGKEYVLCAASLEQARIVFNFVRRNLESTGEYRWIDSITRLGATHKGSNTKLRVLSSNWKTAMGIVGTPLAVCDEAGSWEISGGQLMWDALTGAQGKPGSPLRIIIIGTLAPAASGTGHWYYDLIEGGSHASTYVMAYRGEQAEWDNWKAIKACNPLTAISPEFRAKLIEEREAARKDTRLKARFLSYRLNSPSKDDSETLLLVDDFRQMVARPVPAREGRPVVGVDLGGGRAWSGAVAVYPNGRIEALALAPGIPSLEGQEDRDRVSRGVYRKLADSGQLAVAEGLRVQPPSMLWAMIQEAWGRPQYLILDRFRESDLQDAVSGSVPIQTRVTRWSDSAEDIRALRKNAVDGNLSIQPSSVPLLAASLAVAKVLNDDAGNVRMVKAGTNNQSRDDIAAALTIAVGAFEREANKPKATEGMVVVKG